MVMVVTMEEGGGGGGGREQGRNGRGEPLYFVFVHMNSVMLEIRTAGRS